MTAAAPELAVTENYPLALCDVCGTPFIKRTELQSLCHMSCYVVQRRREGKKRG